jgi:hypothetical protein
MRLNETDKTRKATRVKQPFALTSREIMADLMYPAPVEASQSQSARRVRR